jgi:hypothetical protein
VGKSDDLNNELFLALGKLSVGFSELESAVKDFIGVLLRITDYETTVVVSMIPFPHLLSRLSALYKYNVFKEELVTAFDALITRARECEEERNPLVHGEFTLGDSGEIPIFGKKSLNAKGINFIVNWKHPDEILALVNKTKDVELKLRDSLYNFNGYTKVEPFPKFIRNPHEKG